MDRIDPYNYVRHMQIFGRITITWPPDPKTKSHKLFAINAMWNFGVFCNVLWFTLVLLNIVKLEDDPVAISKSFAIIACVGDSALQLILTRIQWPRLQILIHEVMAFLKTAKRTERDIYRKYIKRYMICHVILYASFVGTYGLFFFSPLILKKRFPIDAWYPFSTEPIFNRIVIYILQYVTIPQTLSLLSGDSMICSLLWYSSTRLERLATDFRRVEDAFQLRNCAQKHQQIIRFVGEIECAIRLLIMKNYLTVFLTIVAAGVQLSHHQSLTVMSEFFFIVCIASVRLLCITWAGDDLTEMGTSISWSIYQSPAITKSFDLGKSLSFAIQRSQRKLIINLWGKSGGLSLELFSNYVVSVMSFFITLWAVIDRYV